MRIAISLFMILNLSGCVILTNAEVEALERQFVKITGERVKTNVELKKRLEAPDRPDTVSTKSVIRILEQNNDILRDCGKSFIAIFGERSEANSRRIPEGEGGNTGSTVQPDDPEAQP